MACQLRIRGEHFDAEAFLAATTLPKDDAHVWTRGTSRPRGRKLEDSGFSIYVTHDQTGWNDLNADIEDVIGFLKTHGAELERLSRIPGIEMMLDFALQSRAGTGRVFMHGEYLPPELLKLAGDLGIGIGISLYPPFSEEEPLDDDEA